MEKKKKKVVYVPWGEEVYNTDQIIAFGRECREKAEKMKAEGYSPGEIELKTGIYFAPDSPEAPEKE